MAFSPKGEYCVTGGQDNHILVWKLDLGVDGEVVKDKVVQEVTNNKTGKPLLLLKEYLEFNFQTILQVSA